MTEKDRILKLNDEFEIFLQKEKGSLISKLGNILDGKSELSFIGNNTKEDIKYLQFEYIYDYLDIVLWCEDKDKNVITKSEVITDSQNSKKDNSSEWEAFIPEHIWLIAADFQDTYEEDDVDDIIEEYEETKCALLEKWFCECWKEAVSLKGRTIDAYFSIHDTIFKTNLNTGKVEKIA